MFKPPKKNDCWFGPIQRKKWTGTAFGILWMPLDTGIFARERTDSEAPHIGPVRRARNSGADSGQHRIGTFWRMWCIPITWQLVIAWLTVTCIELWGSKMWRLTLPSRILRAWFTNWLREECRRMTASWFWMKHVTNTIKYIPPNAPKFRIPQIQQKLGKWLIHQNSGLYTDDFPKWSPKMLGKWLVWPWLSRSSTSPSPGLRAPRCTHRFAPHGRTAPSFQGLGDPQNGWFTMESPNLKWMMTGGYAHVRKANFMGMDQKSIITPYLDIGELTSMNQLFPALLGHPEYPAVRLIAIWAEVWTAWCWDRRHFKGESLSNAWDLDWHQLRKSPKRWENGSETNYAVLGLFSDCSHCSFCAYVLLDGIARELAQTVTGQFFGTSEAIELRLSGRTTSSFVLPNGSLLPTHQVYAGGHRWSFRCSWRLTPAIGNDMISLWVLPLSGLRMFCSTTCW